MSFRVKLDPVDEKNPPLAVIFGIAGTALTDEEKAFFKQANPLGFILFARNCKDPAQLAALTDSLRACVGRDAPVLIDQEGGRVQRLKSPHWTDQPPAQECGSLFIRDFAAGRKKTEAIASSIAAELADAGITVNCAPVLDVQNSQTHASVGDRSFSSDPEVVAALGAASCAAHLAGGVIPVIKHLPGLGRAHLDTHKDLPAVEATLDDLKKTDFKPFRDILTKSFSEAVWGMVAHAIYSAVDPRAPASCSRRVIDDTIRGEIGFDGLLLSDDLSMEALAEYGDVGARAEKVLRAGCDIALHCNGKMDEMKIVAARSEKMTNEAVVRYNRSVSWIQRNFRNDDRKRAF